MRWERLDNTANLFPVIAGESMTNVYRMSITLTENIHPELLQEALDIVLPKFDGFNVRLRAGMFWYYFEENGKKAPKVTEENSFPCRFIRGNKNRSYLFRVTYYEKRINLEVFHVLTDGMGGINFLRELTYQYLRLLHPELVKVTGDELCSDTSLDREDSFVRNYKTAKKSGFNKQKAYMLKMEKLPPGEFGLMHVNMSVKQLKEVCHRRGISINDYFVALYVWSVYKQCLKEGTSDKPIRVAVPVNLRPYFDSATTKNFFVVVSAEFWPQKSNYTFEEIAEIISESIQSQLTKEHLEDLFSYSVSNQYNLLLRPVPLVVKSFVIRAVYLQSAYANTTTITNVGALKVSEPYEQYIDKYHACIAMSKGQLLKGTVCSYKDNLVFTFSTLYKDTRIQQEFCHMLAKDGIEVSLETNGLW